MDFYRMCRICLTDVDHLKGHYLFDDLDGVACDNNLNIADVLAQLTNLTISSQDNLPQSICKKCYDRTKNCYEFRQQCIRGADMLTEMIVVKAEFDDKSTVEFMKQDECTEFNAELEDKLEGVVEPPGYECEVCKKTLKLRSSFIRHIKHKHPDHTIVSNQPIVQPDDQDDTMIEEIIVDTEVLTEEFLGDVEKSRICLICMKSYQSTSSLNYHIRKAHPNDVETIDNPTDELQEYGKFVSFDIESKTSDCDGRFKKSRKAIFFCDYCDISFSLKPSLQRHMRNFHSGTVTRRVRPVPNYEKIKNAKTRDGDYRCEICQINIQYKSSYVRHVRKYHTDTANCAIALKRKYETDPIFYCQPCDRTFTVKQSLDKHNQNFHSIDDDNQKAINRYFCPICDKLLKSKSTYNHHMKLHNGTVDQYICDVCGKGFQRRDSLRDHMNKHTNTRPYKCKVCSATFRQSSCYDMHKQLHEGKKHKCEDCDARFITKALLTEHRIIVHQGIRRFQCDQCPNSYFRRSHLKTHQNIHKPKQFPCTLCGREYVHYESLRAHMFSHTGKPYPCPICTRKFVQRNKLKKHLIVDHLIQDPVQADDIIKNMVNSKPNS